ncbi:MAG: hypothetical protein Q8M03_09205 [Legionella sp.]|nr:hypothetical protein [Legionella sp.]
MKSLLIISILMLAAVPAHADTVEEFYKNRSVTLIIGGGSGGAYDVYARLFARHWGRHIPGRPVVVAKNLPTAGGLVAANNLYAIVDRDGLTVAAHPNGISLDPLLRNPGARFDAQKFGWIGSLGRLHNVCVTWHTNNIKLVEDAKFKEVVLAGHTPSMNTVIFPRILNSMIGTKFKVIGGYEPGQGHSIALEQGEVDGVCGLAWATIKASRPHWISENKLNVILQMGFSKHADLPNVPNVRDLLANENDQRMLDLILTRQEIGRPISAPPDIPKERLQALRQAFTATIDDSTFIVEAQKSKLEIEAISGAEIDEMLKAAYSTPRSIVDRASRLLTGESASAE